MIANISLILSEETAHEIHKKRAELYGTPIPVHSLLKVHLCQQDLSYNVFIANEERKAFVQALQACKTLNTFSLHFDMWTFKMITRGVTYYINNNHEGWQYLCQALINHKSDCILKSQWAPQFTFIETISQRSQIKPPPNSLGVEINALELCIRAGKYTYLHRVPLAPRKTSNVISFSA